MATKFLRRTWRQYKKLGKGNKKKQVWRSPKGRHNKMREKRRGYAPLVDEGYKKDKKVRGKINNMIPILVRNLKDLSNIKENQIAIIGKIGKKNKIEIIKAAKDKKIKIQNVNIKKFLKQNPEKIKENKK